MAKVKAKYGIFEFTCDKGDKSCLFCANREIFYDYTSGPYMNMCEHNHGENMTSCGATCKHFKLDSELEVIE